MNAPRGTWLFSALVLGTLLGGCQSATESPGTVPVAKTSPNAAPGVVGKPADLTRAPASESPSTVDPNALASSNSTSPVAAVTPSEPPTPAQLEKLHGAHLNDQMIAQVIAAGQLSSVLQEIERNPAFTASEVTTTSAMATSPTASSGMGMANTTTSSSSGGSPRTEQAIPVVDLWVTAKSPTWGYGQYTYLLLARDDTAGGKNATRARNLKLLQTAIGQLDPVAEQLRQDTPTWKLNIVLIPMRTKEPAGPHDDAYFNAVLDAYDWSFASKMRAALMMNGTRGPFLYSAAQRWDKNASKLPEHIEQDLSGAPDSMVLVWWSVFLQQSSRPDFWRKNKTQEVAMELRQAIELAAEHAGESESALKSVLAVIGVSK